MSNEQSQPSELGLAEAAQLISNLSDAPAQPESKEAETDNAEVEETEAAAEESNETYSEDDQAPDQGSSDEEEDSEVAAEDGEPEDLDDDTLVTVKIDGKTQQVTLKEALEGYQRTADYSRKTQALAEERKALEAERYNVVAERTQYSQLLGALGAQLQQFVAQEPNWEELHREDPINYPIIRDQWRDYKERLNATQAEQARLQQLSAYENQAQLKKVVQEGKKYLETVNPEWADQNKWESAKVKLREYGQKVGYTEDELSQAYDPRALVVLDKARKYDELMANKPKPMANKPNAPKPMKSGGVSSSPKRSNDVMRMKQRLKSSGHVNDAAALFGLLDSKR